MARLAGLLLIFFVQPGLCAWTVQRIVAFEYPALARLALIAGSVTLECGINEVSGDPHECAASSGHLLLSRPAADAVKKWRFRRDGTAGANARTVTLRFEFEFAGKPADKAYSQFSFEFPNLARIAIAPPCPTDVSTCNIVGYSVHEATVGNGPRITAISRPYLGLVWEGTVELACEVDRNGGGVTSCFAETSPAWLRRMAIECVRQWRFPVDGQPLSDEVRLTFRFQYSGRTVAEPAFEFSFERPNVATFTFDRAFPDFD